MATRCGACVHVRVLAPSMKLRERVTTDGYSILPPILAAEELDRLEAVVGAVMRSDKGGARNLLQVPEVTALAAHGLAPLVSAVLGPHATAVRAIIFDKTPHSNWRVAWHQDLAIALKAQRDVPGFGPWSVKAGVVHSLAPQAILERMIAVRLHLDECGTDNGPVKVLPGTHLQGRIPEGDIATWHQTITPVTCCLERGGVLIMRPLLLHSSSPAQKPGHRRVLHIEYAATELPGGLEWQWRLPLKGAA